MERWLIGLSSSSDDEICYVELWLICLFFSVVRDDMLCEALVDIRCYVKRWLIYDVM